MTLSSASGDPAPHVCKGGTAASTALLSTSPLPPPPSPRCCPRILYLPLGSVPEAPVPTAASVAMQLAPTVKDAERSTASGGPGPASAARPAPARPRHCYLSKCGCGHRARLDGGQVSVHRHHGALSTPNLVPARESALSRMPLHSSPSDPNQPAVC